MSGAPRVIDDRNRVKMESNSVEVADWNYPPYLTGVPLKQRSSQPSMAIQIHSIGGW
jgi:hypothetical protein